MFELYINVTINISVVAKIHAYLLKNIPISHYFTASTRNDIDISVKMTYNICMKVFFFLVL